MSGSTCTTAICPGKCSLRRNRGVFSHCVPSLEPEVIDLDPWTVMIAVTENGVTSTVILCSLVVISGEEWYINKSWTVVSSRALAHSLMQLSTQISVED